MNDDKPKSEGHGHPVGTAAGGVVGAMAAGAVAGGMAGPVGAVAGAVIGAAAGALTGRAFADLVDPETEVAFWREQWQQQPERPPEMDFDQDYSVAYRYGVDAFTANPDRHFNEMEAQLSEGWESARGGSRLAWPQARLATLDAWQRVRDLSHRNAD